MPGVFINYRRQDSAGHAGRLCDRLQARLGRDRVFMDVTGVEPGADFEHTIERVLESCDVLLAVIGREWLTCRHPTGGRRLDDPNDFVRLELAAALRRDVRVVPVLIGGASTPSAEALPEELKALSRRQAVELRDTRWDADTAALIERIALLVPTDTARATTSNKRRLVWLLAGAAIVASLAVPAQRYFRRAETSSPPLLATTVATPVERVLTYSITTSAAPERSVSSAPRQVAGDSIFTSGDLVRFSFSSPQAGFLYVINESPPDKRLGTALNILFPSPTSNGGSARLEPDQDVRIPETGDGFAFDDEAGQEKLWLVWSATRIHELDALRRWANPTDRGEIKDTADIQTVRQFLIRHAASAPEVREDAASARTILKAPADLFVKVVTLEHGP